MYPNHLRFAHLLSTLAFCIAIGSKKLQSLYIHNKQQSMRMILCFEGLLGLLGLVSFIKLPQNTSPAG
jgi:hypothetical protein